LIPKKSITAIRDALALHHKEGETLQSFRIEPDLIRDAMDGLPGYRKLFAPFISGVTDTSPAFAAYEQMRTHVTKNTILLFVECQTTEEFREALGRLPNRESSEWRSFDGGHWDFAL
jgi:hypothetical protein